MTKSTKTTKARTAKTKTKKTKTQRIIWSPQPRQADFMARPEYECLYGGAAGGGKSDALLAEALRQVHVPNYRAIIFRDTYPQLEGLIARSYEIYKPAFPKAVFNARDNVWKFPSGAKIFFGAMQRDQDRFKYQGKAYDLICFDELTHFSKTQYDYLKSRNRPTGPGTRVYIRATANPDGKGMGWVKERFVTPAPPLTTLWDNVTIQKPNGETLNMQQSRIFVPSSVFDNTALLKNDPQYLAALAALPEAERNALLYGNWDSYSGQVFREWKNEPEYYQTGKWTHVINPIPIPEHWKIYCGYDFGYAKPFSVGWFAINEKGKMYMIKEFYGCTGEPDVGLCIDPTEQARRIKEIENNDPILKGKKIIRIADPAIFDESRGESIAQMQAKHPFFLYWRGGDHTRLAGKMQFHYRLAFDETGDSMFQVFNTCKHFIRTIPNLVYSERNPEDIDTTMEDHAYDMTRYVMMDNIIPARANRKKDDRWTEDDPLDQRVKANDRYKYYR